MIGRLRPEGLGVALNNDDTLPDGLRQTAFTSYVSLNPPSLRTEVSTKEMADGLYLCRSLVYVAALWLRPPLVLHHR